MIRIVISTFRRRFFRQGMLFLAILLVSAAFGLFLAASETTVLQVNENLAQYWRTTYDILVRPPSSRSEIEEDYGLVQGNHLSGIAGGISFEQYDAIRQIPGIEVAAPIAMLDYAGLVLQMDMGYPNSGISALSCVLTEDEGARVYRQNTLDYYVQGEIVNTVSAEEWNNLCIYPGRPKASCNVFLDLLMAAIDPEAEAALIGLDQAVEGGYLQDEPIAGVLEENPMTKQMEMVYTIPILINKTPYLSLNLSGELALLELPANGENIGDSLAKEGRGYLMGLNRQLLVEKSIDGEEAYALMLQQFLDKMKVMSNIKTETSFTPSPISYRETVFPKSAVQGPVLEAIPIGSDFVYAPMCQDPIEEEQEQRLLFRESAEPRPIHSYKFDFKGSFDIDRLTLATMDLSQVPLETYIIPKAVLRYDENGDPVDAKELRPGLSPFGYLESPPLMLTTLEAARSIAGEDSISAIRVRVSDIDSLTPEAESKIEAVASEIVRRTGLEVDVVVGSSPRPILVHIPGLGYVEENWIQKGVSLTTRQEVQRANLLLFVAMLGICSLFIFNTTTTAVIGRVGQFALLKALGWRTRSLAGMVLLEGALIGSIGGLAGTGLALGLAELLHLHLTIERVLLILPLGILLSLVGYLFPAQWAARIPPASVIRQGEQAANSRFPRWLVHSGRSLWRQPVRTALCAGVVATGAGMLAFLLNLLWGMQGYFELTLLGQYMLVQVSGYHWAMVGVVIGIGALAIADTLMVSAAERQREIGVLKAVGWQTKEISVMFLKEGVALGLLGGVVGTLISLCAYFTLYEFTGIGFIQVVLATLAGVAFPMVVGAMAAVYPATVAARTQPAVAMRYE